MYYSSQTWERGSKIQAINEQMKQPNDLKWKSHILQDNGFAPFMNSLQCIIQIKYGIEIQATNEQMKQSNDLKWKQQILQDNIFAPVMNNLQYIPRFKSNIGLN